MQYDDFGQFHIMTFVSMIAGKVASVGREIVW